MNYFCNIISLETQSALFLLLRLFDELFDVIIDIDSAIVSKIYYEKWKFIFCAWPQFGPLAISNNRVGSESELET